MRAAASAQAAGVRLGLDTCRALLLGCALLGALPAAAQDRPFLATWRAVAEEDDDDVWEVETTVNAGRSLRAATVEAEYSFDPLRSIQFEAGRIDNRFGDGVSGGVELAFRQLFNHIDRDGWGLGIAFAAELARPVGQKWQRGAWEVALPFSVRVSEESRSYVHLNLGWGKERGEPARWTGALAGEFEVARRTVAFAELGRGLEQGLANAGVRYWVTRERFAVDLSVRRSRIDGQYDTGIVLGLGWYDL